MGDPSGQGQEQVPGADQAVVQADAGHRQIGQVGPIEQLGQPAGCGRTRGSGHPRAAGAIGIHRPTLSTTRVVEEAGRWLDGTPAARRHHLIFSFLAHSVVGVMPYRGRANCMMSVAAGAAPVVPVSTLRGLSTTTYVISSGSLIGAAET